jgi:molybdopterin synthase sulfur carrier subunit
MSVRVLIPASLRKFCDGLDVVDVEATDVREALAALESQHPGVTSKLCDDKGNVRRFINIYANQEDIRFQQQLDTPLVEGNELQIIPAIAGGR